jgi:hypothetical protein
VILKELATVSINVIFYLPDQLNQTSRYYSGKY